MSDERETINRRIFAWLNPDGCYHEAERAFDDVMDCVVPTCKHCKAINIDPFAEWNPDYHSWDGMRLLLEGIREKDKDYRIRIKSWRNGWSVDIESFGETLAEAEAVTLPGAVCKAALGLIELNAITTLSDDSPKNQSKK